MASLTTNKNFLSPVGFRLTLDSTKYPNLEYFCTGVSLPDVTIGEAAVPYRGATVNYTGDRVEFSDFTMTFPVTEDMDNYKETFAWIQDMTASDEVELCDAMLSIFTSKNNVGNRIKFKDCFPTSLSGVEFTTNGEFEFLQASATFKYTTFDFV